MNKSLRVAMSLKVCYAEVDYNYHLQFKSL